MSFIPERDFDEELCNEFPRIDQITAFLVVWLRQHHAEAANLLDVSLQGKLWQATTVRGGILIEDATKWDSSKASERPILAVSRDEYQFDKLIINDQVMNVVELTGIRYYMNMAIGSHTVVAASTLPREAELLGLEVACELQQFSPKIREDFGFTKFRVGKLGAPVRPNKEYGPHWAVPIPLEIAFQQTWKLIPQAPILKRIEAVPEITT